MRAVLRRIILCTGLDSSPIKASALQSATRATRATARAAPRTSHALSEQNFRDSRDTFAVTTPGPDVRGSSVMGREAEHSLADFYFSDSDDPSLSARGLRAVGRGRLVGDVDVRAPHGVGAVAPRHGEPTPASERSDVINLSSYNYLRLATHPEVVEAASRPCAPTAPGACGSPLLSGLSDLHRGLERELAAFLGQEDCISSAAASPAAWARSRACCARATWRSSTPRRTRARSTASSCRAQAGVLRPQRPRLARPGVDRQRGRAPAGGGRGRVPMDGDDSRSAEAPAGGRSTASAC